MYTYEIFNYSAVCENGKRVLVYLDVKFMLNGKVVFDNTFNRTFVGVASCHPNDTFDFSKGVAVATLRAKQVISDYIFEKNLALY